MNAVDNTLLCVMLADPVSKDVINFSNVSHNICLNYYLTILANRDNDTLKLFVEWGGSHRWLPAPVLPP